MNALFRHPSCRLLGRLATVLLGLLLFTPAAGAQDDFFDQPPPPATFRHYSRSRDYHVRHLKLVLNVDAKDHSAVGVVTHYLSPLRDGLKTIVLDAGDNLKIDSCLLNGTKAAFTHEKETLTITPPHPLERGKEVAVEIHYVMPSAHTQRGANGEGGIRFIDPNPNDPTRKPGFWTQGETESNHFWVPCYDYPNDKCTSEEIVTVPENWEVIGNGAQEKTTADPAHHTRTFHWHMTQPHSTYLLSLCAGEMDVKYDVWQGVPLIYAVPKGQGAYIPATFSNTPDMLQFFSGILGVKYPWPKYAQTMVFDFNGGMENVSATTLGTPFGLDLTDDRSGLYRISSLTSHELAHQWFGDLVTCREWGDIWLNEGFATYFEILYEEHLRGKENYDEEIESNRQGYLRGQERGGRAISTEIYSNPDAMFTQAFTYDKGGLILHMLRRQLGDADFFRALGYYLNKHRYQPVDTHDLERAIAESTGRDMDLFFDQWVYHPGHPIFDPTWTYDDATKTVVLHIKQTQDTTHGTPVYKVGLTVGLLYNNVGSTGHVVRQQIQLNKVEDEFRLPAAVKPDSVLLDPDHDVLRQLQELRWTDAELPVILKYAPNCIDRRYALDRIKPTATLTQEALEQLYVDALKTEMNQTNAVTLLRRLGDTKKEIYRALFEQEAKRQGHPAALLAVSKLEAPQISNQDSRRAAALEALSKLPPTPADMALLRSLALSDTESYTVVEAALNGLSRIDLVANLDAFKHQIEAKTYRDRMAQTSVGILAAAKQDAALPLIIEASMPPHTRRVRQSAITALEAGAPDNPQIHTALIEACKSPSDSSVQVSAIRALGTRKDKDALPVLKDLAANAKDALVKKAAQTTADQLEGKSS